MTHVLYNLPLVVVCPFCLHQLRPENLNTPLEVSCRNSRCLGRKFTIIIGADCRNIRLIVAEEVVV